MRAWLLALLLPAAAAAQNLPALHDVTGVAADDVLNIRAAPTVAAEVIGTLAPDATGVEVVARSADGDWGRVNTGGRSGWAAMVHLDRRAGTDAAALPLPLRCMGTEPFWSLEVTETRLALEGPGLDRVEVALTARTRAEGRHGPYGLVGRAPGGAAAMHAVVRRAECIDGMSDRRYGLALDLLLRTGDGLAQYTGCCTLAR